MSELLGDAILETGVDLGPLDRDLAAAKARVLAAYTEMQTVLDRLNANVSVRVAGVAGEFDRTLTPAVERYTSVTTRLGQQLDGSFAQQRIEQAAVAREMERTATVAATTSAAQKRGVDEVTRSYVEQTAAARTATAEAERGGMALQLASVLRQQVAAGPSVAELHAQRVAAADELRRANWSFTGTENRNISGSPEAEARIAAAWERVERAKQTWEVAKAAEEQHVLALQRLATPPVAAGSFNDRAVMERLASLASQRPGEVSQHGMIWGVRGPDASGSRNNPITTVLEAGSRVGLGSLGAAVADESSGGGVTSAHVSHGSEGTTVVSTGAGGGSGGGGRRPPDVIVTPSGGDGGGGGGGGGHFMWVPGFGLRRRFGGNEGGPLNRLLMGGGGIVAGTAALGSIGGFAGLGAEHILSTVAGVAGSAVGAGIGGGLLGLGAAGQLAVGGGSDLAVMKSTIADTTALAQSYMKVKEAVAQYGAQSKQAKEAQHALNEEMAALGNTAGVKAELGLAKSGIALNEFWDKQTSAARVQAVGILEQVLALGHDYVPRVAQAASENLGIINTSIKPLFAWIAGPQGVGIFNDLENRFRSNLPTSIGATTQALEFLARLTDVASRYAGGFTSMLDRLFTRLNSMDNSQINQFVAKMVADFRIWAALIKVVGEDIYLFFHQSQGQAAAIVTGLTGALEKLRDWEKSARGEGQIRSIFAVHKEQIEALGHVLLPLLKTFGSLYLTVAPSLVNLTTIALKAFTPVIEGIDDILAHSRPLALLFAGLLVSIKAFGAAATWQGVKSALASLTGAEAANAAAASADAAAQESVALAGAGAGAGGLAGAAGTAAGAGLFARIGARASGAVEGGSLGLAGILEGVGLGGLAGNVAGAGGVLGKIAGVGLPALAGGGIGFVGSNLLANILGIHGGGKGLLEGAGTGAGIGLAVGGPVGALAGAGIGAGAAELGKLLGLFGSDKVVDIKNFNQALKGSPEQIQRLIDAIKSAGHVSIAGIDQPLKQVVEALQKAKGAQQEWNREWDKSWTQIHRFALGSGPVLRELYERFDANMRLIAHTVGSNSAAGRKLGEENVSQMVSHMVGALHKGEVGTSSAMAGIREAIKRYTQSSGDETPRVYERMFSRIETMFAGHEIGTKTAFRAFTAIATEQTDEMRGNVESRYKSMFAHLKSQFENGEITQAQYNARTKHLAGDSASVVEGSMVGVAESIVGAMESGSLSLKDGLTIIHNNLNEVLKQFGAKPLSMPQVEAYTGAAAANKIAGSAFKGLGGLALGAGGSGAPTNAPESSPGSSAKAPMHAVGGYVPIGTPGEWGVDSVPLRMGGQDIMVAPGEVATVFNRHQLPYVNAGLEMQGFSGLPGLFSSVSTPHHMASGGIVGEMVAKANEISSRHYPYVWGGGHSSFQGPYDCSGAVSAVLHAAGLLPRPEVSGELMNFGAPGPGKVTVYASPAHTFMSILGRFFGTHGADGAGWYDGSALSGYAVRHVPLAGGEGELGSVSAPGVRGGGPFAGLLRGAFKHAAGAANRYLGQHVFGAALGGPSAAHGGFSKHQLERLWIQAGGPASSAHLMAAIALAESGGNPQARNPSGASGLWQILGLPFPGEVFDPLTNARMAVAKFRSQGLGAWETYTNGAYRQFMARGGILRAFAPGGVVHGRAASVSKPRGVVHAKKPHKQAKVSFGKLISNLGAIPGMASIISELAGPEGAFNLLNDEQNLLANMTSNPASILQSDMGLLGPTIVPGEHMMPGMLIPAAEREQQRQVHKYGESEALSTQAGLLQYIGSLDDHRLLSPGDIGVLAKDFIGKAGHTTLHGVSFAAGFPVYPAQLRVLEAQKKVQELLVKVMSHEKEVAHAFLEKKKARRRAIQHLLKVTFARYQHLKNQLARLTTQGLHRKLSAAEQHEARQREGQHVHAQEEALGEAIAVERGLPAFERSEPLIAHWEAERRHLSAYARTLTAPTGQQVSAAHEALQKNTLQNEMRPLQELMGTLGGETTKVGTGGELAKITKQVKTLESGSTELAGKITDSVQTTIPQLSLSIEQLSASLAEAAEAVPPNQTAGAGTTQNQEETIAVQKTLLEQTAQALAVSQAQYKVFAGLPPYAGRFHDGGVVPGPLGAERMILALGGEVVQTSAQAREPKVEVNFAEGMRWLEQFVEVKVNGATRTMSRSVGLGLPSRGGGFTR